jgi:hypothetical protein
MEHSRNNDISPNKAIRSLLAEALNNTNSDNGEIKNAEYSNS